MPAPSGGFGAHCILQQESAGWFVVDGNEDRQGTVQVGAPAHLTDPRRIGVADDPRRLAQPDPVAADGSRQAVTVHLLDVFGQLQRQSAPGASGDDRAGQHVRRHLVQRRGQSQHLVGVETGGGDHVGQDRVALGRGASPELVQLPRLLSLAPSRVSGRRSPLVRRQDRESTGLRPLPGPAAVLMC